LRAGWSPSATSCSRISCSSSRAICMLSCPSRISASRMACLAMAAGGYTGYAMVTVIRFDSSLLMSSPYKVPMCFEPVSPMMFSSGLLLHCARSRRHGSRVQRRESALHWLGGASVVLASPASMSVSAVGAASTAVISSSSASFTYVEREIEMTSFVECCGYCTITRMVGKDLTYRSRHYGWLLTFV
jgi:hypothetical protein